MFAQSDSTLPPPHKCNTLCESVKARPIKGVENDDDFSENLTPPIQPDQKRPAPCSQVFQLPKLRSLQEAVSCICSTKPALSPPVGSI